MFAHPQKRCYEMIYFYIGIPLAYQHHWKPRVVTMPTWSSLVTLQVVVMTICGTASDDQVGIMKSQFSERHWWHRRLLVWQPAVPPVTTKLASWKLSVFSEPQDRNTPRRSSHITSRDITMTSQWVGWRLNSPASPLFTQPFIRAQIKENIKAPRHWPLCGEFTGTGEFPEQMASNAETVSIWWRHHELCVRFALCCVPRQYGTGQFYPSLHWLHNEHDGVSNHRRLDCLLNRLFRRRSKKTSKLRVTGLCDGNSSVADDFPAQRASNAENASI